MLYAESYRKEFRGCRHASQLFRLHSLGLAMIFAAIDPGAVHAAIAVFRDGHPLFVDDIRTTNGMLDAVAFARALSI